MNLQPIIEELADQADGLLAHAANRKEAKSTLADVIERRHSKLSGVDRQKIVSAVMEILEEEEFFASSGNRDSWNDGEDDEE